MKEYLPLAFKPNDPGVSPGSPRIATEWNLLTTLAFDLDLFGRLESLTDAAYEQFLSTYYARQNVVLNLVASVAASYIQLRLYDWQMEISLKTLEARNKELRSRK